MKQITSLPSLISLLALTTFALGCDGSAAEEEEAETTGEVVEIFSWWVSNSESDALARLLEVYSTEEPEVEIVNAAVVGQGVNARELLAERLEKRNPPDTFQENFGHQITRYVSYYDEAPRSVIVPIDDLAEEEGWLEQFPEPLLEQLTVKGSLYAVPVNIHRNNSLFYNIQVLEDADVEVPTSFAELLAACDAIESHDPEMACISIGSKGPWTLDLAFTENVLLASAGADYYEAFLTGKASPADPEYKKALQDMLALAEHFNSDRDELEWADAVRRVGDGKAAMTIMGDWAKGELIAQGLLPNKDFGGSAFPGTDTLFVFTGDCFPLVSDAKNSNAARELLRVLGSVAAQDAFNPVKGSIPARMDADSEKYDSLGRQTIEDFRSDRLVSSQGAITPAAWSAAMTAHIAEYLVTKDPQLMIDHATANYHYLQAGK